MTTQAPLSRKDRRVQIAKAAKIYGIKGQESLDLHEAFNALARGEVMRAVQLAHPVTQSHPASHHAWTVMGGAALAQREGATAKAFFAEALAVRPKDPLVLGGMAKAHVLAAEVEEAVGLIPRAFVAGSEDVGLARLYLELMSKLGRRHLAADLMEAHVRRLGDGGLCLKLADMLIDADEPNRAAEFYDQAWMIDPQSEAHRIGRLRALVTRCRFAEAEPLAQELLLTVKDRDAVMGLYLLMLRVAGRAEEAERLANDFDFATPEGFAHARGVLANIYQDRGDDAAADAAFLEAIHVTGSAGNMAKAYGVFLLRKGDYAAAAPYYVQRFPAQQRALIPAENAAPDNLPQLSRVILMGEQGIGDQLALLNLLRIAPLAEGAAVTLVTDARFGELLENNGLDVGHHDRRDFLSKPQQLAPNQLVYLGDLVRYLDGSDPEVRHGGYLVPEAARIQRLRERYTGMAAGAPVIGVAWKSASLIGHLRSIPLSRMVRALPQGALVVNLQYGETAGDIAEARAVRPDLRFVTDETVDQMTDLAGFAAQIAALDHVASIDNTTAHMCGALGHTRAHLLIPEGADCMWYWGGGGETDPWYGAARLHRQERAGDWEAPLAAVETALAR